MMEFINGVTKDWSNRPRSALQPFLLLLAPYAPHLAEELWNKSLASSDTTNSLTYEPWPAHDESLLIQESFNLPVQVNGKVRGTVEVPIEVSQEEAVKASLGQPNVSKFTEGKEIKKVIYVKGKILNLIV